MKFLTSWKCFTSWVYWVVLVISISTLLLVDQGVLPSWVLAGLLGILVLEATRRHWDK